MGCSPQRPDATRKWAPARSPTWGAGGRCDRERGQVTDKGVFLDGEQPELPCGRCGQPADVAWCDVRVDGDPQAYVLASAVICRDLDCDEGRAVRELADRGVDELNAVLRERR